MDLSGAFAYARGAVFHLEVALPELEAAAASVRNGDALAAAAAGHLRSAIGDLGQARTLGGAVHASVGDAALAARLADIADAAAAGTSSRAGLAAVTELVRGARADAQAGVDALVPHLTEHVEPLGLNPAAHAPREELALVEDAASARRFHAVSDVQRAALHDLLEHGTIDPAPVGWVGGYGNGNGAMPIVRVTHPSSPHLEVRAVHRPPTAQAAQEEFFARLAEHAGADAHYAPAVRRGDGSALVPLVPGAPLWEQDVHSVADIEDVMSNWYRQRFENLPEDEIRLAGRVDRQVAQSLDFVAAQPDRNAGGALAERAEGEFHFIDNGLAGRGETSDPLRPALKSHFLDATTGHATLEPAAREQLAAGLTDEALADAHAVLRRPAGDLPEGHAGALRDDASPRFLTAMLARRDHLVEAGAYDYHPIDLNANPLAHMDWLHSQGV
ncbi:MAG: hypothetical protein JWM98_785 [Thermoleophilia bacterium]|nr:hypothetical protein [Thermoleophilia bacterium]